MIENRSATRLLIRWYEPLVQERTWRRGAYLLSTFPLGQFWFVASVTLLSVGFGLLVVGVGFAILAFLFSLWRIGARIERHLAAALGETAIPNPRPVLGEARGPVASARRVVTDAGTWRDGAWLFLLFPLGIVWLTFLATVWGIPVGLGLSIPLHLSDNAPSFGVGGQWMISGLPEAFLATAIGIGLLPLAARVTVAMGDLHAGLAKAVLSPDRTEELEAEVKDMTVRRDQSVATGDQERRRIERDLHDGAQQRLVAVAMELGRAKEKFEEEPEEARRLVDEAHSHTKEALEELRNLARGIHPSVLTDRGLDPALSALAARSPIPVRVFYRLDRRPPVSVESAAYFVVSEALANVGKHALASIVDVTIKESGDGIEVEVVDDGVGGALPTGSGLSGLADRVEALGGHLQVISPIGGPTQVIAEIPCGW